MAWGADVGLRGNPATVEPMYTLLDRRRVISSLGVERWEYRGRYLDGHILGLISGVFGQLFPGAVRHVSRAVYLVRNEQQGDPPPRPTRGEKESAGAD